MWRRLLFPAGTRSLFRTCKPMHPISAFPGVARPSRTTSTIPESEKTIYSLSSGAPRSAVAIVRISGPRAHQALEALSKSSLPEMRRASVRTLYHPKSGAPLDKVMNSSHRPNFHLTETNSLGLSTSLSRTSDFHRGRYGRITCPWRSCHYSELS